MSTDEIVYVVFGILLLFGLILDLGLLSKKDRIMTISQALLQTLFWVVLALGFFVFLWLEEGRKPALEYFTAYLMEWSLSIDNIFVFILIFNAFGVKENNYSRVLLLGILMAIILRVIFITAGVTIVNRFEWVLLIFGAFLIYTGFKMFIAKEDDEFKPYESMVYRIIKKILPLSVEDHGGRFVVRKNGKRVYTSLFIVVLLLASIDLVFALDSIPAVLGISTAKLVIYTSNIFAVLGLRSLFFLLRGAVNKFGYLQQGIAVVLIFIGIKMLGEHWINEWMEKDMQVIISLAVILLCVSGSIVYSVYAQKKQVSIDEAQMNVE